MFLSSRDHGWPFKPNPSVMGLRPDPLGRIRIGLVSPGLGLGGAERWMIELVKGLDRSRLIPSGIADASGGHSIHPEIAAEMRELAVVDSGPDAVEKLAGRSDVLVCWGYDLCKRLPKPRPAKIVYVAHGSGEWSKRQQDSSGSADGLAAVAKVGISTFPGEHRGRVKVIHNGVDPERVRVKVPREEQRRRWGLPEDAKVFGYLGRLSPEKYPEGLFQALACLPHPWFGVCVGNGDKEKEYRRLAEGTCPGRIMFPGPTKDVGSALGAFDALYLGSHEEAFSLALTEAWLAKVPVIGTRVGIVIEHPELVREIPIAADGPTIARALLSDVEDWEGTITRVEAARAFALSAASLDRFGREWSDYLVEVANTSTIEGVLP